MAGVDAASETALLLDFLGHVCCGVSRRRPLQKRDCQRDSRSKRQAACEFRRQNSACDLLCALPPPLPRLALPAESRPCGYLSTTKSAAWTALRLSLRLLLLLFSLLFCELMLPLTLSWWSDLIVHLCCFLVRAQNNGNYYQPLRFSLI